LHTPHEVEFQVNKKLIIRIDKKVFSLWIFVIYLNKRKRFHILFCDLREEARDSNAVWDDEY